MDLMDRTAQKIARRLDQDSDCVVGVDGTEGSGKSVFAMKIASRIGFHTGVPFTLDDDHVVYRQGRLVDALFRLPKKSAALDDEMIFAALNRNAMTRRNKELGQAVMVCRDQNKALVYCVPTIWYLDPIIRDHRTRYWFHVEERMYGDNLVRGFVECCEAKRSKFRTEPYWKLLYRYRFTKLSDPIYEHYRELKRKNIQEEVLNGNKDGGLKNRDDFIRDAVNRGISHATIGKVFDLSQQRISQLAKSPTNNTIE